MKNIKSNGPFTPDVVRCRAVWKRTRCERTLNQHGEVVCDQITGDMK